MVLKQLGNCGGRDRRIGVAVGYVKDKSSEGKKNVLSVGGKSEETADMKKYQKMIQNLRPVPSELFK